MARQNPEAPGIFQAYGIELPTGENLEAELDGEWKKGKYGFQLDVSYFHVDIPQTADGIEAYLSSDMIKGIGPVLAHCIVEKFGKRSLYVLDHTPERLLYIHGLTGADGLSGAFWRDGKEAGKDTGAFRDRGLPYHP